MILPFTLIVVALAILLLLLYVEGGRNSSVNGLEDLAGRTRPVDLEAFRNLVDAGEEDFLRANLSRREFRAVQRERTRAAVEYIRNSAHNAACLLRLGEAASRSGDPRIARSRTTVDRQRFALACICAAFKYPALCPPGVSREPAFLRQIGRQLSTSQHFSQSTRAHAASHPGNPAFDAALRQRQESCSENPNSTAHRTQGVRAAVFSGNRTKERKAFTG